MEKKQPRFPNKVEGDGAIEIPNATIDGKEPKLKELLKGTSFTYSFTAPINKDIFKSMNYVPETTYTDSYATPNWYFPEEKKYHEIEILKARAKKLLEHHYSVGAIVNEFGTNKFPKNKKLRCKCGEDLVFIVDYFVHMITVHNNSLSHSVVLFQHMLDKIAEL